MPHPALAPTLVDGRARLTVAGRDLGQALIERVEVEWPDVQWLPDGGNGLRNRRGRLRAAILFIDGDRLARRAAGLTLPAGGITRLDLSLEKGRIALFGRAESDGRSADFSARLALGPGVGRRVRFAIEDLRIHGTPPLPATSIAASALAVLRGPNDGQPTTDVVTSAEAGFEADLLSPALDEILVAEGWRLPDTAALKLRAVAVSTEGVGLSWSTGEPGALDPAGPRVVDGDNEVAALRKAIASSRPGAERAELAQRLAAACERAGDEAGAIAALRACLDNAPAGPLVGPAWRRLVELYARGGDPHAAARTLIASADDARTGAPETERAATLVAAAEILRKRLGLRDDASMLLERAVALDPKSGEALEGLEAVAAEAGDHARLAEILERKLEIAARGPVEKKEILVRLAEIYDGPLTRPDRARATHERALEIDPDFAVSRLWLGRDAWVRGDVAAAARDIARALETAPGGTAAIDLLGNDESLSALVAAERARLRLAGPGGASAALDVLRAIPPAKHTDEALVLLADLSERERQLADALPALEELRSRARAARHATEELDARIRTLSGTGETRSVPSIEELERQLSSNPSDDAAAEALAGRYTELSDPTDRAAALAGLLTRAPGLSEERRKTLYAAVGESAEASGDLERAEQAYWRAAQIEAEPALRANYLCAHARVLLARGEIKEAFGELTAALELAPRHVGAMALLADLCFRTQNWERAHTLYTQLEAASDAADVIPRTELVHRCAALALRAGDAEEGEALYRELAILNPQSAEARGALAELARARGDVKTAAQRLEEVLRLLPQGATAELNEVRQRLGAVYAEMGEWAAARAALELVLAQDPGRTPALETLVDAYENLGMFEAAAEICGRLSRLYTQPARRAAALYRQAEILRARIGDTDAALNAYLRSSDLDPYFVPARLRLVDQFWAAGDLDVVADVANDLRGVPLSPADSGPLVVRLAIASASTRRDRGGSPPSPFLGFPTLAVEAARALAEAADRHHQNKQRGVGALDPMLSRARSWAGQGEPVMVRALTDLVLEDPTRPGPAIALARLAELAGRRALAGAAYALPAFLEPDGFAARQLASLVPPGLVRPEAVRIGGPVDHPGFAGPARRALARLAPALLGFGTERPAPKPTEGSGLPLARAAELRRIGELLDAPAFVVAPDVVESETADDRRRLRVVLTQPAGLMVAAGAAALSENAWSFIAARALETLRSGLWMAGLAGAEGLAGLLEGARSVLRDNHVDDPRSRAVAEWLRQPQASIFLGPAEERVETLAAVEAALAALPDWTALTQGAQHTRNRIGLIACANPGAALAMIKADDRTPTSAGESLDARRDFLRRAAHGDLIKFMFSPGYEAAFS